MPTLIVHTKDDQLASHEASKRAAERIPGARERVEFGIEDARESRTLPLDDL